MVKKHIKRIFSLLCIMLILYMTLVFVTASAYSVLVAEDFMHAVKLNVYNDSLLHYIKVSLIYAVKEYFRWQGTYSAMFIQAVLSPLNTFGLPMLRFDMVFNAVLFFVSVLILVFAAMKSIPNSLFHVKLAVMTLIVFMLTGYQSYTEIFFWFSGAASFSFPLSFMMIGLACFFFMNADDKMSSDNKMKSRWCLLSGVLSVICAFVAMGGTLMVAGLGCFTAMLIYIFKCFSDGKIKKEYTAVFAAWVFFAFINGIAPGNYKRQSIYTGKSYGIVDALTDTVRIVSFRWSYLVTKTNYLFIICILVICGLIFGAALADKDHKVHMLWFVLGLAGLFSPFCTAFPAAYGYAGSEITNRCEFMVDLAIILSYAWFAVMVGISIGHLCSKRWKVGIAVVAALSVICLFFDSFSFRDIRFIQMSRELSSGQYAEYYDGYVRLMEKMGTYEKGSDVLIPHSEFPKDIDNIFAFYISDDPEYWINPYVAEYFGYNSIAEY